ncbi:MAG TPA: IclR family transcriptional regulator [Croceibacterium sp.]
MTEDGVKAARVAIAIVELLARHDELGVSEIARAAGTTKARAYRHLRTLVSLGYAIQHPGSDRYARGPRMVALARVLGMSAEDGLIELARPVLQELHQRFAHSFNLSLVHGEQASIVETLPGKALIGITVRLNEPIPLHATAAGKLLLADRLERGVPLPGKFARFTDATITAPAALRAELERVAERGWADAPQQSMLGINAVSAPIRDHRDALVAMISAMDSIQFIPPQAPARLVAALRAAAAEIGRRIGL